MIYINDPEQAYKTYDEVAQFAVANGVEPKRVYIFLVSRPRGNLKIMFYV